jgi:hypothetical protein
VAFERDQGLDSAMQVNARGTRGGAP